jgi:hypothetical protein
MGNMISVSALRILGGSRLQGRTPRVRGASVRERTALLQTTLLSALLTSACTDGAHLATDVTISDSAGVRIVQNPEVVPDGLYAWRLSSAPVVDIGSRVEPEYQLFQATSAVRLVNGTIVVANRGTNQIRRYDAEGTHLGTHGGNGRGPGEFQQLLWVGALEGDSILAWDHGLVRWSIFGTGGDLARTVSPAGTERRLPLPHGVFGDGSLAFPVARSADAGLEEGTSRDSIIFVRIGRDGTLIDTLGTFPGLEMYSAPSPGNPRLFRSRSIPFGKQTHTAVYDTAFYVATGDAYEYVIHSLDGRPHTRVRRHHRPVRVTAADVEDYKERLITLAGATDAAAAERRRMLDAAPYPATMPALDGLIVDAEQNVWVRETRRPRDWDNDATWSVFDPDGRFIATVQTPPRFTILQIGHDWVLGAAMAEDDVEHIRVYRLTRGGE